MVTTWLNDLLIFKDLRSTIDDIYLHAVYLVRAFHLWTFTPWKCCIPRQNDEPKLRQLCKNLFAIFAFVTWRYCALSGRGKGLGRGRAKASPLQLYPSLCIPCNALKSCRRTSAPAWLFHELIRQSPSVHQEVLCVMQMIATGESYFRVTLKILIKNLPVTSTYHC